MEDFMKVAIDEARYGIHANHGGPFGAVIVKNGKVVARAHNTVLRDSDPTCHAEIQVIREASKVLNDFDLTDCELYTTGKPCPMCESAIKWAKIDKVYYGCDYNDAKEIGFDEEGGNNDKYEGIQVNKDECEKLYEEYKSLDRETY